MKYGQDRLIEKSYLSLKYHLSTILSYLTATVQLTILADVRIDTSRDNVFRQVSFRRSLSFVPNNMDSSLNISMIDCIPILSSKGFAAVEADFRLSKPSVTPKRFC